MRLNKHYGSSYKEPVNSSAVIATEDFVKQEFEEYEYDREELRKFKLEELWIAVEEGSLWWVKEILEDCCHESGGYLRVSRNIAPNIKPLFDVEKDLIPLFEEAARYGQFEIAKEILAAISECDDGILLRGG